MISLVSPLRSFLKLTDVTTDNIVFRLHYRLSVVLLILFTLLVTSKQFFGSPIYCMGNGADTDSNIEAINNYCWIYGTYSLKSQLKGFDKKHHAYPGVGPQFYSEEGMHDRNTEDKDDQISHQYYQWVCFMLLGQAALFYAPRWLWKMWEGGRLKALATDLSSPVVGKQWQECKRGELVSYLNYTNLFTHNVYAYRYVFCEVLNFVNVVSQIFLLDRFFGGTFRSYGAAVAAFTSAPKSPYDEPDAVNPMNIYFPKITKCMFYNYGTSGSIESKDRLCVLTLNIVNEKIFLVLWFWLIILSAITGLAICFRVLVIFSPTVRTYLIMAHVRYVRRNVVKNIVDRFGFGDWFIFYLLGKNMNPIIYKDLIMELSKEMDGKPVLA